LKTTSHAASYLPAWVALPPDSPYASLPNRRALQSGNGNRSRRDLSIRGRRARESNRFSRCPMPQAIVDPAELRRFAMNLKRFNGELMNQMGLLHSQLLTLGNTWRDQEQIKFT